MTLGADPLTAACVMASDICGYIIRKESKGHGSKKRIEGPLESWHQVAILEDVTTTGGTILEAAKTLREADITTIVGAFTVVDRGYGATENLAMHGIKLHSVLTAKDIGIEGDDFTAV